MFLLQGLADADHAVGAARALMDVDNEGRHEQASDLAIARHVVFELVVDTSRHADDQAGPHLAETQVAQRLGNLARLLG